MIDFLRYPTANAPSLSDWREACESVFSRDSKEAEAMLLLMQAERWDLVHRLGYLRATAEALAREGQGLDLPAASLGLIGEGKILDMSIAPSLQSGNIAANTAAEALHLAALLTLATIQVPVAKTGDFGYGYAVESSDILAQLGVVFAQNSEQARTQLKKLHFCYLHLPHFYPRLQRLESLRKLFGKTSLIEQAAIFLHPIQSSEGIRLYKLIGTGGWAQTRFFRALMQENAESAVEYALLYDQTEAPLMSLCADFFWQNSPSAQPLRLSDWQFAQLPQNLLHQYAGRSVADAAQLLMDLLTGAAGEEWTLLLLANVAFIAQTVQPQRQKNRSLLDAEAALSSGRVRQLLEKLRTV